MRYDERTRRAIGQRLLEHGGCPARVLGQLAGRLGVTERTLRNWKEATRLGSAAKLGRPAHGRDEYAAALRPVARAWKDCGRSSGETQVYKKLASLQPRRVIRRLLRDLKAHWRKRQRLRASRDRVSIVANARDVLWPLDATHVGRDGTGAVQSEVLRDAASTSLLSVSLGRSSTGAEVVTLLERTSAERGGPPLVLWVDRGSNYASDEVLGWADEHHVVVLQSLPRVPQHNPYAERGNREIKEDAELGKGWVLEPLPCVRWTLIGGHTDIVDGWGARSARRARPEEADTSAASLLTRAVLPAWCRRMARCVQVLNECRARSSRGGWTASALDAALPRGDDLVCRESFHRAVCRNVAQAESAAVGVRATRRARREAILCTLESYGLITRTRGGRPWSQPISESHA